MSKPMRSEWSVTDAARWVVGEFIEMADEDVPPRLSNAIGELDRAVARDDAADKLDDAWADVESALDGRLLRIEYDPTVPDLPWAAEVLEVTVSGDNVAAHVDSDSPGGALEALLARLSRGEERT